MLGPFTTGATAFDMEVVTRDDNAGVALGGGAKVFALTDHRLTPTEDRGV